VHELVGQITNLLRLNLSQNLIKDLKPLYNEENFKSLRVLDLSKNKVIEVQGIKAAPLLNNLNLSENFIEKLEAYEGHPKIRILDLRGNKIANLATLSGNMPELREINLVIYHSK
jgi:Leucine-rich repeat (LRR) protein